MLINKNYRPEIDSLRAFSILAVLIYHLEILTSYNKFFLLNGGFLGVDTFFVISGYLITTIILNELKKNNFSILYFFQRRIRRILPVFLFVVFLTNLAAWFLLLPNSLENFSKSVLHSIIFNSNFYFWYDVHQAYSHEQTTLHPLLHTWSLAIEEQYYLIVPFILIFLFKNFSKKLMLFLFIVAFLFSLLISIIFINKYPSFVFYMLPFRIWEILLGSICAWLLIYKKKYFNNKNILALAGIILIFLSIFLFDKDTPHPSILTLAPVLGTAFVILFFDKSHKNISLKFLENKKLVSLGLISYTLYIVHFPIISLSRRIVNFESNFSKICLILFSVLISVIIYKYIEKPFRKKTLHFNKVLQFCGVFFLIILIANILILNKNGFVSRIKLNKIQNEIIFTQNPKEIDKYDFLKSDIVIIGNSHAIDFEQILKTNQSFNDLKVSRLNVQISCLITSIKSESLKCERTFNIRQKKIFNEQLELFKKSNNIILKTRWYDSDIKNLNETISFLKKLKKNIILIGPNPEISKGKFEKNNNYKDLNFLQKQLYENLQPIDQFVLKNRIRPSTKELDDINKKYKNLLNINKTINLELEKIAKEKNITFIDFYKVLCGSNYNNCDFVDTNSIKIYRSNQGHFTQAGVVFVSKLIGRDENLQSKIFFKQN